MVHTCNMAGGATTPPCTDPAARVSSVYTGLWSPSASVQCRIIGWLTGSLAGTGSLSPPAAIRSAAAVMARWASSVATG